MKRFATILTAVVLCILCAVCVGALERETLSAVKVYVGNYESQRSVSWYSDTDSVCKVRISENSDMSEATEFSGKSEKTPQGDYISRVPISNLEPGKVYWYVCESEGFQSTPATISVSDGTGFSAMYVTDVHISGESLESEELWGKVEIFEDALESAREKADVSLLISGGDQASAGVRAEYTGFAAPAVLKSMTIATSVGNHDRKNIDYKYFADTPYSFYAGNKSYVGRDYWFVKDDVLFMMLDTNCPDANAHRGFMMSAVAKNRDVKWRVAVFHHDLYGDRIEKRNSENALLRLLFTPLMDEFKVDLALMGHSHYYTRSDIMYAGKAVTDTSDVSSVTDAAGTLYITSGSLTSPRYTEGDEIPPLGENVAYDYLSDEGIYNILSFSESELKIDSYTVSSDEPFNSFSLYKSDENGGHRDSWSWIYNGFIRLISTVVAFFNNIGTTWDAFNA